ncbi:hypothetical protein HAX54_037354 [Datura stramonium]|uniref:DUF7798 domain-containing protein n=1 Tax=Datura stramonium TaxID=4076 RepID=A0ABS8RPS4_DATST|nr:hypothetical protein [Datura stramonium]
MKMAFKETKGWYLSGEGIGRPLSSVCKPCARDPQRFLGISDVTEAYLAASKGAQDSQKSIQEKANVYSGSLRADLSTAICKIQDGIQCLSYVVVSTSMPAA